jgi:hypothetical protein
MRKNCPQDSAIIAEPFERLSIALTNEELADILNGVRRLWFYGLINVTDAWGGSQIVRFCAYWIPNAPRFRECSDKRYRQRGKYENRETDED